MKKDFTQRWIVDDDWTYTADLQPYLSRLNTEQTTLLVFHGLDTVANIVRSSPQPSDAALLMRNQTIAGHPVAWVNNQFRRYTYDVTSFLADPVGGDHNLTVAFKSAWHYGLNVTSRSDAEFFPTSVRTSDKVSRPIALP